MTPYELTNDQRRYFGLSLVTDKWDKHQLDEQVTLYFEGDKIVKILNYRLGYFEYDTDIKIKNRHFILPKTIKGKEQKLTSSRVLKIKGSGVQFSGSFQGGGIHVYDNRRNLFFIKSFVEGGEIKTYENIENWIKNYIANLPSNYFDWLGQELSKKRVKIKIKEGDIVAFKIAHDQYGFARILLDVFAEIKKGEIIRPELCWVHPRSLIVAPYAYYTNTLQIDIDNVVKRKTLPTLCIFDLDVYRGEMPIVGHMPLSESDKKIPFPEKPGTSITIPYTKAEIETFIATS